MLSPFRVAADGQKHSILKPSNFWQKSLSGLKRDARTSCRAKKRRCGQCRALTSLWNGLTPRPLHPRFIRVLCGPPLGKCGESLQEQGPAYCVPGSN